MVLPAQPAAPELPVQSWRVLHACENYRDANDLAEAQSGVGMHPQLLARELWNESTSHRTPSLIHAWQDVRDWRHALNDAEALTAVQIVHAHSFAAAMAAVRGTIPTVYDFAATLEESAAAQQVSATGVWLMRSLRVAEQFALSRAGAVVTHTQSMRNIAGERGAPAENVFVVPEPSEISELVPDRHWAELHGIDIGFHVVLFALPAPGGIEPTLRAFANIVTELENALLIFELGDLDRAQLLSLARELQIADVIRCVSADEHAQATACADVVLAPAPGKPLGRANRSMLQAMAAGKALVAADVQENRECSPDGTGVIWYREADSNDLAHRAAFVARNADFSRSLGQAGRMFLEVSRSPSAVGRCYDHIYRHARSRRRDTTPKAPSPAYAFNV